MNKETTHNDNITHNVLEKIRAGEIHMTSKNYFRLKLAGLVVIIVAVLIISSFLFSYILFSIKASGQLFLLGFGGQGVALFFLTFPWRLFFVDVFLVLILEWFLKRFKLGYRYSFIQVMGAMVIVTIILGELLNLLAIHRALLREEQEQQLPYIGMFYKDVRRPPKNYGVYRGIITSISNNSFILENDQKDQDIDATTTEVVTLPPDINLDSILEVGDSVFVAGSINQGTIQAYGIRKLSPDDEF